LRRNGPQPFFGASSEQFGTLIKSLRLRIANFIYDLWMLLNDFTLELPHSHFPISIRSQMSNITAAIYLEMHQIYPSAIQLAPPAVIKPAQPVVLLGGG
jgi:hypothetical protein